jgi:DNA-binding transcriptional LysR family regulator
MGVFVAVVEAGGFSAASRALGMPLPTVCRKVAELENHLGAQLLIRSTRKVAVTDSGHRYYEDVRRVLEDLDTLERQAAGEYQRVTGLLTITAPSLFGSLHVLPIVNDFMYRHDEVEVRLLFTNHVLDLPEEQIDLGVRIGTLSGSTLTVLRAGSVRQVVCASPAYLDANGRPASPGNLTQHRCITFSRSGGRLPWAFKMPSGKFRDVAVRPKLTLNSAEAAVDAALRDGGLTQLYSYQAAPHVATGELEIVLKDFEIQPSPVNLIFPHGQRVPQKLRAFIDFAMPALGERLATVSKTCDA